MLSAWATAIGTGSDKRLLISEVIKRSKTDLELATAIAAVVGQKADVPKSLGIWLRGKKGTLVGDLRFNKWTNAKGVTQWWVETV